MLNKLFKNNKRLIFGIFVFLFICVILAYLSGSRLVENFDMNSLTSSLSMTSVPGSTSGFSSEYDFLAPIPPETVWSDEIQNTFVDKYNIVNNLTGDKMMTKDKLPVEPYGSFANIMSAASEKEAQYYIDNGFWPWDEYVTNFIKNDPELSTSVDASKANILIPNRQAYQMWIEPKTVPLIQFLAKVFSPSYKQAENDQYWQCTEGILQTKNGSDGQETTTTDYSFFEKNITDFHFTNGVCNPCAIPSTKMDPGRHPPIDVYNSPNNQCKFTVGTNPEAYNIFMGSKGLASTATSVSDASTVNYEQCVTQCDKYKT